MFNHELMAAVELASKYYMTELTKGVGKAQDQARFYISERRLFLPMVETFRIGFSPKSAPNRPWILARFNMEEQLLIEAGILNRAEDGRLYDPMEGRLVFPQVNPSGKYLGFVGRVLPGVTGKDKYLSTGTTPIFRRAEVLYRIDKSRLHIEAAGQVIVVEGLLDAALMFQVGMRHVVATGTKAMTDAQAQILQRYAKVLSVMFDNNQAGKDGYEDVRRRRGGYFQRVDRFAYPAKFDDPAEWVADRIDTAISGQGAALTITS